jgi:hypothetical protein
VPVGKVSLIEATVAGPDETGTVQRVLRRRMSAFRSCYKRALRSDPNLGGTARIDVTIGRNGRVTRVKVVEAPEGVGPCIGARVRVIRFLGPGQPAETKLQFSLAMTPAP